MINLMEEDWFMPGVKRNKLEKGESAKQLALIIDQEVVSFLGISQDLVNKIISGTNFQECFSSDGLYCVSFELNGQSETILCNEMTQAILLSSPEFVLVDKSIQRHAEKAEPSWLYVDGQFIVPGVYE
jgi:hypothetical protein